MLNRVSDILAMVFLDCAIDILKSWNKRIYVFYVLNDWKIFTNKTNFSLLDLSFFYFSDVVKHWQDLK
jgi:hypothetical protein